MNEILIFLIFAIILILFFLFLAFSLFWGAIIMVITAVVGFFTAPFDKEEDLKIIRPQNKSAIICIDSDNKNLYRLEMGEYIIELNKSSGEKYIITNNDKRFKINECFYADNEKYL